MERRCKIGRGQKEGLSLKEGVNRQRSQGGEGKWFYHKAIKSTCQMDIHSSDALGMKIPALLILYSTCV